ncbi:MAG: transketolase [Bosea sp.]|nr:transketolase [Bosea sp. (in: a-proteobacteria)]
MTDRTHHDMLANAIRSLAMDAVEQAKSGHPGLPMGAADVATVLFSQVLKFDAADPAWPDRDRFVLSAGHGSMLIYALLYLTGTPGMTLDEIRRFRQLHSLTPGHPEVGHTPGIETTTGPLGQGLATAVGMAMAERMLAAEFGKGVVGHHTYVLASDGDLMEGISQEAIALAGHQKLNKLIVLFDDNGISIDGPLSLSDSVDQIRRFQSAGWRAERVDGHDPAAILAAIERARAANRPSLIACRTVIGYGSPKKAGTSKAHGEPLGAEELAAAKARLGVAAGAFDVPEAALKAWRAAGARGAAARKAWDGAFSALNPRKQAEFKRRLAREAPAKLTRAINAHKAALAANPPTVATRKASEMALEAITPVVPELVLGSADLTPSNNTRMKTAVAFTPKSPRGRYVHYGIREHAMAAAMNGMLLHGGLRPAGATFMVFTDYCRPAIRLAALMNQPAIYVMTHDSIGLGEDGPTHQPVEHLAALRAIPNLRTLRPADAMETAECWQMALERTDGPTVLALTRQNLAPMRAEASRANLCAHGAYELLSAEGGRADATIFATGSEVEIAAAARKLLSLSGVRARVVSVPSLELFLAQPEPVRRKIIGPARIKVAVEAGIRMGWDALIGPEGGFVGMSGFGASAPYKELYKHFGITAEAVAAAVKAKHNQ